METLASGHHPPWTELPDDVTENILERLPLSGYVRFAAVCRRWRSVQTSGRRRHSPSPPPMAPLPWPVESPNNLVLRCYSPFEDKLFTLPSSSSLDLDLSSRGWSLSLDDLDRPSLFHPISASTIDLPPSLDLSYESLRLHGFIRHGDRAPSGLQFLHYLPSAQLRSLRHRLRSLRLQTLPASQVRFQMGRSEVPERSEIPSPNNPETDSCYPEGSITVSV